MISIVVVHWNTSDLLAACLQSIQADSPSGELLDRVVVVDCGSSEGCAGEVVLNNPGVELIQLDRNDGYAAGCNVGYARTSSDFVLFLNADTELQPCATELLLRCINLNPRIGLVAPLLVNPDGTLQSTGYRFPGITNVLFDVLPLPDRLRGSRLNGRLDPGNLYHPYTVDYALGAAILVRRAVLDVTSGWPESYRMYSEEVDLARRLNDAGWLRLLEPRATVVHHGGASTGQRPVEMQAALWHSRGRYHRIWSSRIRQLALRSIVECATRLSGRHTNGTAIRRSFVDGLMGR